MSSHILLDEIRSPDDALEMAACRNQVRTFMTHNQAEILPEQQLEWFRYTYTPARSKREMLGYVARIGGREPIGYGLISQRNWLMWVSGGIIGAERGKGYGRQLFDGLTQQVHDLGISEVYLDVLEDNEPARTLYESLGYVALNNRDGLVLMVHRQLEEAA